MADNRQYSDHNSIGNVNVYYKDRQLKERTAVSNAASIANLKFLLTTGDDEGFRTAIKSYIDEAIRSALGALVDNLDKGTGVSRILGTDSSHDLGTITPANLASVLGALVSLGFSNFDYNNPPSRCFCTHLWYGENYATSHAPKRGNQFAVVLYISSQHILELSFNYYEDFVMYIRMCQDGSWGSWRQIPTQAV